MTKPPKTGICIYCEQGITRVRTPIGSPRFAWTTKTGFYCPRGGGWHEPKPEPK